MKKVNSLILCALLVVSFILTAMPVAMAAETDQHNHAGYVENFAGFDFENLESGTTISKNPDTKYDSTNTYYMSVDTITIAEDDAQHGKVAQFTGNDGKLKGIGIAKDKIQKNPNLVKVEVELKRTGNQAVYLQANGISGGKQYELMLWGWDGAIQFNDDGTRSSVVGNVSTGDWCKITLYFDFTEGKREYCAYINDSFVGTYTIPADITGGIKEFYVTAPTTVSVDNLKLYALTDSDLHSGYTSEIANFDFEDLDEDATVVANTNHLVTGNGSVTIVRDADDEHDNVAKVSDAVFGIATNKTQSYPAYVTTNSNPGLLKFEIDIKKENSAALYLYICGEWNENRFLSWINTGEVRFKDGTSATSSTPNISSGVTKQTGEWLNVKLYVNFAENKYDAYLDNKYINTYTLPMNVGQGSSSSILKIDTDTQGGAAYVDNISVNTIPAYEAPVISEFTNRLGEKKLAFVGTNTETTAKAYKILCAKYNSDNTLDNVTMSDGEIAASTKLSLEELAYPTKGADGSYYKYFVWNNMMSMVPLVESITLN